MSTKCRAKFYRCTSDLRTKYEITQRRVKGDLSRHPRRKSLLVFAYPYETHIHGEPIGIRKMYCFNVAIDFIWDSDTTPNLIADVTC